jgi:hypothetical protein
MHEVFAENELSAGTYWESLVELRTVYYLLPAAALLVTGVDRVVG